MPILIIILKYLLFCSLFSLSSCFPFTVFVSAFDIRCFPKCLMTLGCSFLFKNEVLSGWLEALCAWLGLSTCGLHGRWQGRRLGYLISGNYKCRMYRSFLLGRLKLQQRNTFRINFCIFNMTSIFLFFAIYFYRFDVFLFVCLLFTLLQTRGCGLPFAHPLFIWEIPRKKGKTEGRKKEEGGRGGGREEGRS